MKNILGLSVLLAFFAASACSAAQQCFMSFSTCPQYFNRDTINVPPEVVGLAPAVPVCNDAPSVGSFFFIIDNSGSMKGNNGSDPTAARFTVTKALLDTLFAKQPQTQVGLAVIQEILFFNASSNYWYSQYFKRMSAVYDSQPNQAYVPMMTLNQMYGAYRGIDILDSILSTTGTGGNTDLKYQPNYTPALAGLTNINIAFLAAREAFANVAIPKSRQSIIFLSDGEANQGQHDPGIDSIYYWRDSTRNLPTTFTVFFSFTGVLPADIQSMTQNIALNGYSPSNPSSACYAVTASFNSLMNVLLTNVINPLNGVTAPVQMSLNSVVSATFSNGSCVFPDAFLLGPDSISHFSMLLTFANTNSVTGVLTTTSDTTAFDVRRLAGVTPPPGIDIVCSQNSTLPREDAARAVPPGVSAMHLKDRAATLIRYALPRGLAGTDVWIGIYTAHGRLVKSISDKAKDDLSTVYWNECDASTSGMPVRPGTYVIRLRAAGSLNLDSRFAIVR